MFIYSSILYSCKQNVEKEGKLWFWIIFKVIKTLETVKSSSQTPFWREKDFEHVVPINLAWL